MPATKIATCCYCGTRAALVLSGRNQHELACSSCGAPLHDLKMLPKREKAARKSEPHLPRPGASSHERAMAKYDRKKPKKKKKSKSFARSALSEIFDIIEDIID